MIFQMLTLFNKKTAGENDGKKSQSHSLRVRQRSDFDAAIPFTLITVATPARATQENLFDLRLQGPFNTVVRTGLTPLPCSLSRRFSAYSSSSQPLFFKLTIYIRLFLECQVSH